MSSISLRELGLITKIATFTQEHLAQCAFRVGLNGAGNKNLIIWLSPLRLWARRVFGL